jgi:hypothetical protein
MQKIVQKDFNQTANEKILFKERLKAEFLKKQKDRIFEHTILKRIAY